MAKVWNFPAVVDRSRKEHAHTHTPDYCWTKIKTEMEFVCSEKVGFVCISTLRSAWVVAFEFVA